METEEPAAAAEQHAREIEVDLGNLCASDPAPPEPSAWAGGTDAACHAAATRLVQALTAQLFALPSEPITGGRLVALPPPSLALPREKPIPKPRPPTKWELFAQKKGIQKRKRSSLVYDETRKEWKRRHGYKRGNDEGAVPIIDARPDEQPGEDPFSAQRSAKKARVAKQDKRQLANLKAAAKAGGAGALPPTLRLAAALPEHGRGMPAKRKELKGELSAATRHAAVSTASAGKFDRRVEGERPSDRAPRGRKNKFLSVADKGGTERSVASKAVDHILHKNADDIVDVSRAISRFEHDAREERSRAKNKRDKGAGAAGSKAAKAKAAAGSGGGGKPVGPRKAGGGSGKGGGGKGGKGGKGR